MGVVFCVKFLCPFLFRFLYLLSFLYFLTRLGQLAYMVKGNFVFLTKGISEN